MAKKKIDKKVLLRADLEGLKFSLETTRKVAGHVLGETRLVSRLAQHRDHIDDIIRRQGI